MRVWDPSLTPEDGNNIREIAQSDAVSGLEIPEIRSTNILLHCKEKTMPSKLMRFRKNSKMWPGAVMQADVVQTNFIAMNAMRYFFTFIHKASGYFSAGHMKTKEEAPEVLKRHASLEERRTDCRAKSLVSDDDKTRRRNKQPGRRLHLCFAYCKLHSERKPMCRQNELYDQKYD